MSAIRLARGATGRDEIAKVEGCYHGHADSLLVEAGSGVATLGIPGSPGVPGALAALTFSLAREFAPHGVTVNGIAPAYIESPMITDYLTEQQQRRVLETIPVRRFCRAEEVAHVVRFLISPLSGFITGEIIDINGGLHMD